MARCWPWESWWATTRGASWERGDNKQQCSQQYGSSMAGGQEQECSVLHLCWQEKKECWGSAHSVGRTAEWSAFSLNVEAVRTGENDFLFVKLCLPDWGSAHRVGRTAEWSAFSLNVEAVHTGENVFFFVILCLPDQQSEGSEHWGSVHRGGRTVERSKSRRTLSSVSSSTCWIAIIHCQLAP